MTAVLSPAVRQQFTLATGAPAAGYKLFTYAAGTTTKRATFTDSTLTAQNTNPIILDSLGAAAIWFDSSLAFKFVLAGPTDTDPPTSPIWTVDNIAVSTANPGTVTSVNASGGTTGLTLSGGPITSSGTFTLAGTLGLANGGTGGTTQATARAGLGAASSGVNTDITQINTGVQLNEAGPIGANTLGFRGAPQNVQTSTYTLQLTDSGRHIFISTGGVIVPANAAVAFPIGTVVVIVNNSGASQSISITSDVMTLGGTSNTGTRTLAQFGVASLLKTTPTGWVITGNVT